jgi:probable rRNA maturation factor
MTHAVHLQGVPRQHAAALRRAIRQALSLAGAGRGSLTLRLAGEDEVRRLNSEFAHNDQSTDVLSFPDGSPDEDGAGAYFGDVVIALPIAAAQAAASGHEVQAELVLLAVHGTLHLLGQDHAVEASRRTMWELQDQILSDIGCPLRSPQGDA